MGINKKYIGFTLAEVLITLGVIGIVAAMTLPTLLGNIKHKQLQTAFKKAYNRHSEALMLVKAEAGVDNLHTEFKVYDGNSYTRKDEITNMYMSKLKIIGKCKYKKPIRNYNNTDEAYIDIGGTAKTIYLLSDGSCMNFLLNASTIGVTIDTNGAGNGPNRLGHDVFTFHLNSKGVWEPVKMTKLYTDEEVDEVSKKYENQAHAYQAGFPCSIKSKQKGNGMGCAWYAFNDISPEDNKSRYWENLPK